MLKHKRAKRNSGALDRYLKDPNSSLRPVSEKIKVTNPQAEFEAEQEQAKIPFKPSAVEPKPEQKETQIEATTPSVPEAIVNQVPETAMPLYCNFCDMVRACPQAKGKIKRRDQKELIVCTRRAEFRQLIGDAGTSSRNGLIDYIHKLRQINSIRIGQMLFKEALSNSGADKNLTTLIDKQIETALAEYKLLTPQEKNINNFSFRLTAIHKTVDTFNELPPELKGHLLSTLKKKLAEIKAPLTASKVIEIGSAIDNTTPSPDLNSSVIKVNNDSKPEPVPCVSNNGGGGGEDACPQAEGNLKQDPERVEDL